MSSKSSVVQTDSSIKIGESVGRILGSGSSSVENTLSDALQISGNAGTLTVNQFPQTAADAVSSLVGAVNSSIAGLSSVKSDEVTGDTGQITKMVLYAAIAIAVIVLGRKFL
jgi:hypothetical protein